MNRRSKTRGLLLALAGLLIVLSAGYTLLHLRDQVVLTVLLPGFVIGLVLLAVYRALGARQRGKL